MKEVCHNPFNTELGLLYNKGNGPYKKGLRENGTDFTGVRRL